MKQVLKDIGNGLLMIGFICLALSFPFFVFKALTYIYEKHENLGMGICITLIVLSTAWGLGFVNRDC